MEILIYSLGCPRCNEIIALAKQKNIKYTLIADKQKVFAEADKHNLNEIPFAIIDGIVYDAKAFETFVGGYYEKQ